MTNIEEARLTDEEIRAALKPLYIKGETPVRRNYRTGETTWAFQVADAITTLAYQKGFDEGLKRTLDAADSTFKAQLKQAQEDERKCKNQDFAIALTEILDVGNSQEQKDWVKTWFVVKSQILKLRQAIKGKAPSQEGGTQ